MIVICDEVKALQEKAEIDVSIPKRNRRAKLNNAILVAVTGFVAIGAFWTAGFFYNDDFVVPSIFSFTAVLVLFVLIELLTPFEWEPLYNPKEMYSVNTEYCLVKHGKNILDRKLECNNGRYWLVVHLEDENHVVSKERLQLYLFSHEVRTDILEITIDLIHSAVYFPYEKH